MDNKNQIYYEMLTRLDHPVFKKDYSEQSSLLSPLNSILNRVMARQLVKFKTLHDEVRHNLYPSTVTALTIDDWESEYFGFTKPSLGLQIRVNELAIKVNKRFKMNVQDAIDLARSIVGITPAITRNASRSGWSLGTGALGVSTTLGTTGISGSSVGLYLIYFPKPVDSSLLEKLDQRLTIIEKAGSRHKVKAPPRYWVLGNSALGIDTTLGAS
jgi:hypothetical protein